MTAKACATLRQLHACGQQALARTGRRSCRYVVGVLAGLVAMVCYAAPPRALADDANVNFSAHLESQGLVFDHVANGEPAVLVPAGSLFSSGPNYLLKSGGKTVAAFWVDGSGHATVRRTADPSGPLIGRVLATWDHGAIRLTLEPADGQALQLGRFHRIDHPRSEILGVNDTTVLDLRGMYVAQLRNAQGENSGWLRVRSSPYQDARRVYEGNLPASVPEPLAAAAVLLVNSDISSVRSHTVDVYLGN
ncbi:MAG TPA: hypothetical protein VMW56_01025 [Candidatus Margulisiibacteriota bacterium]|nr:hypothetical protein [Candidatus Margulisiibacteriota bacterium]